MKIYLVKFQTTHGTNWVSSAWKNKKDAEDYIEKCKEENIIDDETQGYIEQTNLH